MAKIKLQKNDLFLIIPLNGKDYFQFHGLPISTGFKHVPSGEVEQVSPETYECESTVEVEVNHDEHLVDMVFGGSLPQFVGPRPKNIVRR